MRYKGLIDDLENTAKAGAAPATVNKPDLSDATFGFHNCFAVCETISDGKATDPGMVRHTTCEPGDRPAAQQRAAVGS